MINNFGGLNSLNGLFSRYTPHFRSASGSENSNSAQDSSSATESASDSSGSQSKLVSIIDSLPETAKAALDKYGVEASGDNAETSDDEKQSLLDSYSGLDAGINNLLSKMGLDPTSLSSGQSFNMEYIKAQFTINYRSIETLNTANGIQTREVNFSFNASFEYLQAAAGTGVNPFEQSADGEAVDPLEKLQEYFSPDKTASRILDFALSFFPQSSMFAEGGNTEDSRSSFADFIGDAIQKGFDQAGLVLGDVSDEVQDGIDETHDKVFTGLDDFVKNGYDEDKSADDGLYAQIQAYRMEMNYSYSYSSISSYNNYGEAVASPYGQSTNALDTEA